MCGIAGFWEGDGSLPEAPLEVLRRMTDVMHHRGPDDEGHHHDRDTGIGLGHRRLSIVDLSAAGHQPMESESGRYVMVFNGEVYNHHELRRELTANGHKFNGHSDTEVMLAAFEEYGFEPAIRKFNGMFALALLDRVNRQLTLARDRIGIKPLYYGMAGSRFVFASELKSLREVPGFNARVDRGALTLFLRHNYVPSPYSIYSGIRKLRPGCAITLSHGDMVSKAGLDAISAMETPFWSARDVVQTGLRNRSEASAEESVDALHDVLRAAVGRRMIADVPLGAFLSGGIDSSTVVALMQEQSSVPVKTFSIGFSETGYNEANFAAEVARHLGTDHTEHYVSGDDAMATIPKLAHIFDEPFADSSQIPTYLVSELARRHVTVSLSGDGGDELFAGYNRYLWGHRLWGNVSRVPRPIRSAAASILSLNPRLWGACIEALMPVTPRKWRVQNAVEKAEKLSEVMGHESLRALYKVLISHWTDAASIVKDGRELETAVTDGESVGDVPNEIEMMMAIDLISYLPDDILTKVDRASMAVSLEARVPLLDHEVVEFAWKMPFEQKLRNGVAKWPLRQVLSRYVPEKMIDRPKMGFGIPVGAWLRGPLRDWCDDLLSADRLHRDGYFDVEPIVRHWAEHRSGKKNHQYLLWDILMFQSWLEASQAS